jgi:hypothetical protein
MSAPDDKRREQDRARRAARSWREQHEKQIQERDDMLLGLWRPKPVTCSNGHPLLGVRIPF